MKIVQVAHSFPPYSSTGTEVYTYNLSQALAQKHKIFIFHRINNSDIKEYELRRSIFDNFTVFTVNNTFRLYDSFEATYKNETVGIKFGAALDEIKPDIIHIQNLLYLGAEIIEEAKKRKIPVVFTLNDYWLLCPQGQLLRNNINICSGKNSIECISCVRYQLDLKQHSFSAYHFLKKNAPGFLFRFLKEFYLKTCKFCFSSGRRKIVLIDRRKDYLRHIYSKVDLFISPSQFLGEKFIESGFSKDKIAFSSYGFDLDRFKDGCKTPSSKLRFGFIGNIMPAKGIHVLIKAFNAIKNNAVELKIYGESISYKSMVFNYKQRLKRIIRNKNIKFMGGFDNREAEEVFKNIDVLVMPSIWYENLPLVIQEAFITGTPVVASSIGGIPELITDGVNGFLFKAGDAAGLVEKINLIIDNPHLVWEVKKNIRPPKDIRKNAQEMESIYEGLLVEAKAGRRELC